MSLFDVIRYPISDAPASEELARLPEDLFMRWKIQANWPTSTIIDPDYLSNWYRKGNQQANSSRKPDIELLRKMIRESDE